jgi:hypothetical protein
MNVRSRARSATTGIVLAGIILAGVGRPMAPVLARMTDAETVASTFSTETLDAPTGLAAAAALLLRVNLTWTATVDARATGYLVLRGTANGGPYTLVATITSRTTTAYQDTVPLPGQYYYVLRTYFATWTSVNSNQASVLAI